MQTSMYAPPLSKLNRNIIIAVVALFLVDSILKLATGTSLVPLLGLSWSGLSRGLLFQPLTFVLIENSLMGVIFNCLLIWFIGSELEMKWGAKFYIKYLVLSILAAAVVYIASSLLGWNVGVLYGLGGPTYALLVAYGLIYADRMMTFMLIFPMKAKYFCLLLAALQVYLSVFASHSSVALIHLSSMAFGFFYLKFLSMRSRGQSLGGILEKRRKEKLKKNLYIVPDDEKQKANPKDPRFWQ